MKQGLVNVRALVGEVKSKPPEGKRTDPLTVLTVRQPGKKACAVLELTAWREHAQAADKLAADTVYMFRNLAVSRDKKNTFSLNWLPKTEPRAEDGNAADLFKAELAQGQGSAVNLRVFFEAATLKRTTRLLPR